MTLIELIVATACVAVLSIVLLHIIVPIRIHVTRDSHMLMAYKDALITTSVLERMYSQSKGMVRVMYLARESRLKPYIVFYTQSASLIWAICHQRGAVFGCGYVRGGGVGVGNLTAEQAVKKALTEGDIKFIPLMSTRIHDRMHEMDMSRAESGEIRIGSAEVGMIVASTTSATATTSIAIDQSELGVPIILYTDSFVMQFGLFPLVYLIY